MKRTRNSFDSLPRGIGKQSWKILTNLPEIGFGGFFTTTSLFEAEAVEAAGKLADVFAENSCHL